MRSTGSQSHVTRDQIDQTEDDELGDLFHDLCASSSILTREIVDGVLDKDCLSERLSTIKESNCERKGAIFVNNLQALRGKMV